MKRYFRTIQSVLDSRWGNFQYAGMPAAQKTDRVLQSSKLEDCIYHDLSKDDENWRAIQQEAALSCTASCAVQRYFSVVLLTVPEANRYGQSHSRGTKIQRKAA